MRHESRLNGHTISAGNTINFPFNQNQCIAYTQQQQQQKLPLMWKLIDDLLIVVKTSNEQNPKHVPNVLDYTGSAARLT